MVEWLYILWLWKITEILNIKSKCVSKEGEGKDVQGELVGSGLDWKSVKGGRTDEMAFR